MVACLEIWLAETRANMTGVLKAETMVSQKEILMEQK